MKKDFRTNLEHWTKSMQMQMHLTWLLISHSVSTVSTYTVQITLIIKNNLENWKQDGNSRINIWRGRIWTRSPALCSEHSGYQWIWTSCEVSTRAQWHAGQRSDTSALTRPTYRNSRQQRATLWLLFAIMKYLIEWEFLEKISITILLYIPTFLCPVVDAEGPRSSGKLTAF